MKAHRLIRLSIASVLLALVAGACGSPHAYWGIEDDYSVGGGRLHYEYSAGHPKHGKKHHKKPKRHKHKKPKLNKHHKHHHHDD